MFQPSLYVRSREISIIVLVGQTKIPFVIYQKLNLTKEYHQFVKEKQKHTMAKCTRICIATWTPFEANKHELDIRWAYIYACLPIFSRCIIFYVFIGVYFACNYINLNSKTTIIKYQLTSTVYTVVSGNYLVILCVSCLGPTRSILSCRTIAVNFLRLKTPNKSNCIISSYLFLFI